MVKINIGGVPEHFNYPWHFGIKNELFKSKGIDLNWKNYPGGTGDMCKDLRSKQLDLAIVLTEGIIKDIILGIPQKLFKPMLNLHYYGEFMYHIILITNK